MEDINEKFSGTINENSNMTNSLSSYESTTGTLIFDPWSDPIRIQVNEYPDRIECIYKETSMITYTINPSAPPDVRVFKIIYSCVDGKFHKSERIYGEIVPKTKEYYNFE